MLSMLVFAAAASSQPVLVSTDLSAAAPVCQRPGVEAVGSQPKKPLRAQKLNELPNADAYLTVLRTDEHGCNKPAIVAYDIGSAPRHQR